MLVGTTCGVQIHLEVTDKVARVCYSRNVKYFAGIMLFAVLLTPRLAHSQVSLLAGEELPPPSVQQGGRFVKNLLSVDMAAPIVQGNMSVQLASSGRTDSQRVFYVTLLQPTGAKQTLRSRPNGSVTFTGVREGYASVVVTASMDPRDLSAPYAAMGFLAQNSEGASGGLRNVRVPVANIDVVELGKELGRYTGMSGRPQEILGGEHFSAQGRSQLRVSRQSDGSITGRVISPQRGFLEFPGATRILLFRDRVVVAETMTNNEGGFVLNRAPVGEVSLLAIGASGHAAFRLEIVAASLPEVIAPLSSLPRGFPKLVALSANAAAINQTPDLQVFTVPPSFNGEVQTLIEDRMTDEDSEELPPEEIPPPGAAGGGFAGGPGGGVGGGGSGGGGIGGLSDLAGLAGAAGLAAGVAALADDDDGFNVNQATGIVP